MAGWVSLFRNTSLLVQLFFFVFCRLESVAGRLARLFADEHGWADTARESSLADARVYLCHLGIGVVQRSYLLEELQAGLNALPEGHREAAIAQGFSRLAMLRYIFLPQGGA